MVKVFLAASAAALAISAPATAGPGKSHDKGEHGAKAQNRAKAEQSAKSNRANRVEARSDRQANRVNIRADRKVEVRADRRTDRKAEARADRRTVREVKSRVDRRADLISNRADRQANRIEQRVDRKVDRVDRARSVDRIALADNHTPMRWTNVKSRGLIDGCPPGLYMKANGCLPPGQAKKLVGMTIPTALTAMAVPRVVQSLYPDTPNYYYRYDNGYLYQVDRKSNLIESLIPLLAGGYLPGQMLPTGYGSNTLPGYYNGLYPGYSNQCTRYANGVAYYTDCSTGLIENVVPLYDNGYGVGQMLPASYGYYNVPMQYRDLYYDNGASNYWYAPGSIYQYDSKTQLITSIAALLSPGMMVGQTMPSSYNVYNVPMAYRSTYNDTPNSWYRYSNGSIYQVDPATQLVTALVASILT